MQRPYLCLCERPVAWKCLTTHSSTRSASVLLLLQQLAMIYLPALPDSFLRQARAQALRVRAPSPQRRPTLVVMILLAAVARAAFVDAFLGHRSSCFQICCDAAIPPDGQTEAPSCPVAVRDVAHWPLQPPASAGKVRPLEHLPELVLPLSPRANIQTVRPDVARAPTTRRARPACTTGEFEWRTRAYANRFVDKHSLPFLA